MNSAAVVVLLLVCGVFDMVAFGPTPIMVGATSYRFDRVIESRCNSANEVCWVCGLCSFLIMISWCFFCRSSISFILSLNSWIYAYCPSRIVLYQS